MFCTYDLQHNLSGPAELPGKAIPVPIPKVNGKRMARNVHAPTEEECEQKLAELIKEMKKELGSFGSRKKRAENRKPPSGKAIPEGGDFSVLFLLYGQK